MKRFDTNEMTTEALARAGAFFAFSNEQFDAEAKDGVEYVSLGSGLICPRDTAAQLFADLDVINQEKIKWEIEQNGKKDIIWYELGNHECQIGMDYSNVVDKLKPYGITEDDIKAEWRDYFQMCVDNDYF